MGSPPPSDAVEGKCEGGNALGGYLAPLLRDDALHLPVKTGTALEASHVSLRKWAFVVYLEVTSLKGVSSMKLHRDLGVTPKTARFMLPACARRGRRTGQPATVRRSRVEADEMYVGGRNKNKSKHKRQKIGGGTTGKTAVVGVKDRATNTIRASAVARPTGRR